MEENKPVRRIKRGWMKMLVAERNQDTPDCVTLQLVDAEEGGCVFDYTPGQYLTFRFDTLAPKPIVRSYTMSSSPCEIGYSAITVKEVDQGVVSNYLCKNVKKGDILSARGPIGKFGYEVAKDFTRIVMVAGGSGVTPFLSMLREFAPKLGAPNTPTEMILLVSYRKQEDIIGNELLMKLKEYPNIKIAVTLTRQKLSESSGFLSGHINPDMIRSILDSKFANTTYLTCGPEPMMDMVKAFLEQNQVESSHIKMESFLG